MRAAPRVRFNDSRALGEFEVDAHLLVHPGEHSSREAKKLDTLREDLEFGLARARWEALELERDAVGIATSEFPLVVRSGMVYVFDQRPSGEEEPDSRTRADDPGVAPVEA
eukprot:10076693-Alexandrium_andersonii.AAC.1